ncbi:hypothetical protein QS257_21075 [Terrilactibacillus sp. S3-3]|nr:hypothetical protein QS257_21075 [Terrilactibacillus sp. S3-3]
MTEQQAEAAVAKAAGYSLSDIYVDTTDNGIYYSIELRENHKATGNADPLTAPAIGFFFAIIRIAAESRSWIFQATSTRMLNSC